MPEIPGTGIRFEVDSAMILFPTPDDIFSLLFKPDWGYPNLLLERLGRQELNRVWVEGEGPQLWRRVLTGASTLVVSYRYRPTRL
jgi:hypothetical protein